VVVLLIGFGTGRRESKHQRLLSRFQKVSDLLGGAAQQLIQPERDQLIFHPTTWRLGQMIPARLIRALGTPESSSMRQA